MPNYAFAVPILPGQEQRYRETFEELEGARRDEYEAALAEAGIRRVATWLQEAPDGTVSVVYIDADDESGGLKFASGDAPLNTWFREQMKVIYGFDGTPATTRLCSQCGERPAAKHRTVCERCRRGRMREEQTPAAEAEPPHPGGDHAG